MTPAETDKKEFRKANEAVTVRVRSGPTLTMMGRRLFNVLVYHAQSFGLAGSHVPPPWDTCPNPEDYYWIPLPEIVRDSAWGSKDHKLVISVLQQLQTTLVESDSKSRFSSVQLIGSIHVLKGAGRRPTLVGWEFPRSTRDILSNPDIYTKLSIRHLTSLQTVGGAALYEIGKRYLTSPGGKTKRDHWHWWYDALTGKPIGTDKYPEYRYFKRDTLLPAIGEVNRTDIQIELEELKKGRSVDNLQFIVKLASQSTLELPNAPIIDSTILDRLISLGFSERQSSEIIFSNEAEYLRATLDFVEFRINDKSMEAVKSPAAFMRKALKENYLATAKARPISPETKRRAVKPSNEKPVDPVRKAELDKAIQSFDSLQEAEKIEVVNNFQRASATHQRLKIGGVMFRRTLACWLVDQYPRQQAESLFPLE